MSGVQLSNLPEFSAALRQVVAVTKKTEAEIVTKAAKDVAYRSAQYLPKTTAAQIRADLTRNGIIYGLATSACNKKYGKGAWTRAQRDEEMKAILKRRASGANALRAGWIPAITKLGGKFRGAKLRPNGTAAEGRARAATVDNLMAFIENAVVTVSARGVASGAGEIGVAVIATNRAIQSVTSDRLQYAEKKLKEANRAAQ